MKTTLFGILGVFGGVATAAGLAAAQFPNPGGPGAPGPGGMFGARQDLAVVEQFDKDGNKRLDAAERRAAREFVEAQGAGGRRFGGRGGSMATGSPGPRVSPSDVPSVASNVPFYDPSVIRTIFFEIDSDDWESELMAFKNTDVEVAATMIVDGQRYADVGLSFRGNSSFMMVPAGLKHSFNVTVDFVHADQNVLGYRTLNLLNGNGDASMLRGVLFNDIARRYLPSPGTNFARVVVNGESWGVFTNVEQLNSDFFKRRLDGDNGTRWKVPGSPGGSRAGLEYLGDDVEAYRQAFEIKNKDNRRSWDALINLTRVLNATPTDGLASALEPILDVDGALRFLALDNVLVNSDGYWTRGSDYFLYLDERGRFHVLPNDTNEAFSNGGGPGGRGGRRGGMPPPGVDAQANGPAAFGPGRGGFGGRGGGPGGGGPTLDPLVGLQDAGKPLRSKLLAVPEFRARYLAYVRDIADTWLDWKTLGATAERYHAAIAPLVASDTRKLMSDEAFAASLEELKRFTDARRAYLSGYTPQ